MKKHILLLILIIATFVMTIFITTARAGGVRGTVRDNNNGNKGYILIHSGDVQGQYNDVGTWIDIKDIPELKGEKGDKGDRGERGLTGSAGKDGIDGTKGDKGDQGEQGIRGIQGEKGDMGPQGLSGKDGIDGKDGSQGERGEKGDKGDKIKHEWEDTKLRLENSDGSWGDYVNLKGETGEVSQKDIKRIDINERRINENTNRLNEHEDRIGELEETDVNIMGEIDFIRKENLTVGVYSKYDIRHNEIPEVGLKITIGLGKSEGQIKREELEKRLENLERKLMMIGVEPTVEKTENGWQMSISEEDMPEVIKRF